MKTGIGARVRGIARVENLLPVGTVLGEVLRIFPWFIFLAAFGRLGWSTPPLGLLSTLAVVAVTAFVARRTLAGGWSLGSARLLTLSISVALLLVLTRLENSGGYVFWDPAWGNYAAEQLPALAAALGFGLVLIWRGITIGRDTLGTDYLYRNFIIGIVGFIVLMILWGLIIGFDSGEQLFTTIVPYVLGYFFTALMTLGISNFIGLRQGAHGRPKAADLFARRWLLVLLGVVLVVVLVGGAIGSTVSYDLTGALARALSVLGDWLLTAVKYLIGYPIGYMLIGVEWLAWIIINWLRSLSGQPTQPDAEAGGKLTRPEIDLKDLPPGLVLGIEWALVALVVVLGVFLLARLFVRYWRGPREKGFEEVHESLWSWNGFRADLKSFLKGLFRRRREEARAAARPPLAATIDTEEQYLDIRELYRGLLWEGAQAGHPKAEAQTPYEYERALAGFVPDEHDGLAEITGTYVEHRYGHVPVGSELGMRLMKVWLKLRAALRLVGGGQSTEGQSPH